MITRIMIMLLLLCTALCARIRDLNALLDAEYELMIVNDRLDNKLVFILILYFILFHVSHKGNENACFSL